MKTKEEWMTPEEYAAKVEQENMDFYKAYFWVKTWQIDWYIYTQDKDWNIKIETDNKSVSEEYYVQ